MSELKEYDNCDPPNRIASEDGFKDKTILVSGGTGFIGKAFIEKVCRTCPSVKKIYILIRSKNGKDAQTRLKEVIKNPLFDLLKEIRGEDIFKKVKAITADVGEPDLGLSIEDRRLLTEEVEYLYHLAATTRFDESFKKAVFFNTRGVKLMLGLAKECKRLKLFLHCSTAYCFPETEILDEKLYSPPADPDFILKMLDTLDGDVLEVASNLLMRSCPNTYTYSKALAEGLVSREMDNLPVVIVRPSVIINALRDPLPGWTDNLYGPAGLFTAAGKGIVRSMYCNPDSFIDFITVDIVANALMMVTWDYMTKRSTNVYNLTSTSLVQFTWNEIVEGAKKATLSGMPFNWVLWCPGGSVKRSRLYHQICGVLFHYIPAIFLDALIFLTGNKPVLLKIQKKISIGFGLLEFYANRTWRFNNNKALECRDRLNKTEARIYRVDLDGFDFEKYLLSAIHGVRLYVLKERDETIPTAKRHLAIMWAVDRIFKMLLLFGFFYLLYKHFIIPNLGEKQLQLLIHK